MAKKPQITGIASYIAAQLPTEGVDALDATEAWRAALHYARATGTIAPLIDRLRAERPDDARLQGHCQELADVHKP